MDVCTTLQKADSKASSYQGTHARETSKKSGVRSGLPESVRPFNLSHSRHYAINQLHHHKLTLIIIVIVQLQCYIHGVLFDCYMLYDDV